MENTCYCWMPFKLTEYHSPSFEDIVAFSGFNKNDFTNTIVFSWNWLRKNNKIIVYHKYQHNYTEKYIYYHLKQLWSFLFIKNEQVMFFLIVAIPTSKTDQVIYGKDLILRIYFVKPRFLTTTESYHGYTLTTATTYQWYLTMTTIHTQESELCLHNLCI